MKNTKNNKDRNQVVIMTFSVFVLVIGFLAIGANTSRSQPTKPGNQTTKTTPSVESKAITTLSGIRLELEKNPINGMWYTPDDVQVHLGAGDGFIVKTEGFVAGPNKSVEQYCSPGFVCKRMFANNTLVNYNKAGEVLDSNGPNGMSWWSKGNPYKLQYKLPFLSVSHTLLIDDKTVSLFDGLDMLTGNRRFVKDDKLGSHFQYNLGHYCKGNLCGPKYHISIYCDESGELDCSLNAENKYRHIVISELQFGTRIYFSSNRNIEPKFEFFALACDQRGMCRTID